MNTSTLPRFAVAPTVSPNVPAKTLYWQGYDMYCECAASGDYLTDEEYAAMTDAERRGYNQAARHQADTETYAYLANTETYAYLANTNSFGDRTEW
jgi:hypothetical protein